MFSNEKRHEAEILMFLIMFYRLLAQCVFCYANADTHNKTIHLSLG
jgi:hypothetical protein